MSELDIVEIDLGPCRARTYRRGGIGWAVVMPGASYSVDAPVLWFAREAALAAGRDVLVVTDAGQAATEPVAAVEKRARAALAHVGNRQPVFIGKSVSTLAVSVAAERRLPAVWLTPLLNEAETPLARHVVGALRRGAAPCLLVGGTSDPLWSSPVAHSIPLADVLAIDGGDHVLQIPGDPIASLAVLRQVVERVTAFLADARPTPPLQ